MATQTREIKVGDRVRDLAKSDLGMGTVVEADHMVVLVKFDSYSDYEDDVVHGVLDGHDRARHQIELVEDEGGPDFVDRLASQYRAVNPGHYDLPNGLQVIDIVRGMDYLRGNVIKYVVRAGKKNPETRREDLLKARKYLDWLIEDADD